MCQKVGQEAVYFSETGYSAYYWGRFHLEGLANQDPENFLYKYQLQFHPSGRLTRADFHMTVMGTFDKPVFRQSHEGVSIVWALEDIQRGQKMVILNSKSKFHQPGVVKGTFNKRLA